MCCLPSFVWTIVAWVLSTGFFVLDRHLVIYSGTSCVKIYISGVFDPNRLNTMSQLRRFKGAAMKVYNPENCDESDSTVKHGNGSKVSPVCCGHSRTLNVCLQLSMSDMKLHQRNDVCSFIDCMEFLQGSCKSDATSVHRNDDKGNTRLLFLSIVLWVSILKL